MTDTAEPDLHLGRDAAGRLRFPGPVARPRPAVPGGVGAASIRFARDLGVSPVLRRRTAPSRTAAQAPADVVPAVATTRAGVAAPRWWRPQPPAESIAELAEPAVERGPGLRRAVAAVPLRTGPGGTAVSSAPVAVAVRRYEETSAAGPMLSGHDVARLTAPRRESRAVPRPTAREGRTPSSASTAATSGDLDGEGPAGRASTPVATAALERASAPGPARVGGGIGPATTARRHVAATAAGRARRGETVHPARGAVRPAAETVLPSSPIRRLVSPPARRTATPAPPASSAASDALAPAWRLVQPLPPRRRSGTATLGPPRHGVRLTRSRPSSSGRRPGATTVGSGRRARSSRRPRRATARRDRPPPSPSCTARPLPPRRAPPPPRPPHRPRQVPLPHRSNPRRPLPVRRPHRPDLRRPCPVRSRGRRDPRGPLPDPPRPTPSRPSRPGFPACGPRHRARRVGPLPTLPPAAPPRPSPLRPRSPMAGPLRARTGSPPAPRSRRRWGRPCRPGDLVRSPASCGAGPPTARHRGRGRQTDPDGRSHAPGSPWRIGPRPTSPSPPRRGARRWAPVGRPWSWRGRPAGTTLAAARVLRSR